MEMAFYYLLLGAVLFYIGIHANPDNALIKNFFILTSFASVIVSLVITF